ncbi:MAG: excinuclease ABC subunit UvrC [Oscillospiraceae bacterium]|jgi:excinuclease ABC subunit C|nr:excinuclease ABC subunit UvrC [Oscillospiraceae bacterium]
MTRGELLEKANSLPLAPGVYLMKNESHEVIYVGKAKRLKNRVSQYFQAGHGHDLKTQMMVSSVYDFDTIIVRTEFEALVLENSLIKQHMPRYNILLKDGKGYPFVRLNRQRYPKFSLCHKRENDGARYFGPFGGRYETRSAIDALLTALKLPACNRQFPRDIGRERPCLNHHMGRCDGFCRGVPDEAEYRRRIEQVVLLLTGKLGEVTADLEAEMAQAAEELHFERAAELRDRIRAIEILSKRQQVIAAHCADTDLWGLYRGGRCCYAILHYEQGQLIYRETRVFAAPANEEEAEMLAALLLQYYGERTALPREILLPCEIEDLDSLAQLLTEASGHKVRLAVPQRGEKAELMAMAAQNAREEAERQTTREEREDRTLVLLTRMLGLPEAPRRMEAYDISNTGGSDIVASMTVFHGSRPAKSQYRRFKIKAVENHPDDYRSMEEVLTRRFQRYADGDEKFAPLPDVLLIDGGETHAQVALRVTERFGLAIPIFGMVKDNRHRTRALMTPEGREIGIRQNQAVFALIGQIQEETHRFAITYHHESHSRSVRKSALDDIPGLGPVRRQALLKAFKSVKAIREAEVEELAQVVPRGVAEEVYARLRAN